MSEEERNAKTADDAARTPEADETRDELQSTIDRLQRTQAEFENYKKRVARAHCELEDRVADQVIANFLVPYENIERALRIHSEDHNVDAFIDGVEQVFSQFAQVLERYRVERIPCTGEPFDPVLHEALLSVPHEADKNTIVEELSSGYRRDGRVLRASRVSVSQGPAAREEEA